MPGKEVSPLFSIVVIGRNEAPNLPELFRSLPRGSAYELIYVDSGSVDQGPALAFDAGARVYSLHPGSVYAPSTGRYVGTLEARGRWILYLDGDMRLDGAFVDFLNLLGRSDQSRLDKLKVAGFVGRTRNIYLDRSGRTLARRDYAVLPAREVHPGRGKSLALPFRAYSRGRLAFYHGGAVLYRRAAVIAAGNWNPAVLQLEEVDLFSRVFHRGGLLVALDLPMVDHYTPYLNPAQRLAMNFFPVYRGKGLYGAGQVVRARVKEKTLAPFIAVYPYPFLVAAVLVASLPLFFVSPLLALLPNLVTALWIAWRKRPYYYLVYLGNLVQILRGLHRYRPFCPSYSSFTRSGDY